MKNVKNINKIAFGVEDYIKAVKIADREMGLGNGFTATHKIFKSKKAYNRKNNKKIDF